MARPRQSTTINGKHLVESLPRGGEARVKGLVHRDHRQLVGRVQEWILKLARHLEAEAESEGEVESEGEGKSYGP